MAIALVQNRTAQGGYVDSFTLAYSSDVTANNLLTVCGGAWNGSDISSIPHTDSVSTSYTTILGTATGATPIKPWIAYGIAASSGANTITIDPNGMGRAASYTIAEWSGIDTTTPLDVNGGNSTGSSTTPSDGITTSAADTVVLGVVVHGHGGDIAITPDTGGGWTQLGEIESVSLAPHNAQYQIFSSAGAKTASWTIGASQSWCAQTSSFKMASAGGGGTVHRVLMLGIGI